MFQPVRQDKNEILVTIRGTADLTDAITNMIVDNQELYIPEIGRNLKFHEGILKSSFNVLEHSVPVIDKCLRENPGVAKIVFTGHSLGGGCASVRVSAQGRAPSKHKGARPFGERPLSEGRAPVLMDLMLFSPKI